MAHSLIIGTTESGKTTLATDLCRYYQNQGIQTIVLDPLLDRRWESNFITDDPQAFLSVIKNPQTRSCAIFIDESGEMIGRYNDEMFFLATRGRHYGHNCHFITQRAQSLNKTVRDQCSYLFLFASSASDVKSLSDEYNQPVLRKADRLRQGEYFLVPRWGEVKRLKIF